MDKSLKIVCLLFFISITSNAQKKFIGESVKANYMFKMQLSYYQNYGINSSKPIFISSTLLHKNINDESLEYFVAQKYPNSEADRIQLIQKLTFYYLTQEMIIFKYHELKGKQIVKKKTQFFTFNNESWVEIKPEGFDDLYVMVQYLKPEFFEEFCYNSTVNQEIELIKNPFKNLKGTPDLRKFSIYLKTMPKELEPYCDFD
jgi:hypothetical protein